MSLPPSLDGALQRAISFEAPDSNAKPVGASGVPCGVPEETFDQVPQPALLRARTRTW